MALWLTLVVVLTCFGGLASPGPVPAFTVLRELIEELDNITQKVSAGRGVLGSRNWSWPGPRRLGLALRCLRAPLCNGSMVWSVNLTASPCYAALESLMNVSDCRAIQRTQRLLRALCPPKPSAGQASSQPVRDTKVEVIRFAKDLLQQLRKAVRQGRFP
ncbi:hypothetical protein QTO34_016059 [Cnephaeus nilssonii]|uniref:Interleukin-13 n=1 Tax=Cnephaeus nilssonii TaxID=3371016 RepID=A0AA40I603_CNENI|nr:hypothetical protein QTO34_016059 [Eptesicus nilssonii]